MFAAVFREIRPMLSLALPMILSQLLGFAQVVIDTVMAGRHSALTLAGVSLGGQIFSLIYVFVVGVGIGLTAQLSHHHGTDSRTVIRRDFQQGLWLFAVLGVFTAIATALGAFAPRLIGSAPDIAHEAEKYLLTLAIPASIFMLAAPGRSFLEGMAAPRDNNLLVASLLPLNIAGNWYFLHYTELGTQGMAISTGICYTLYTAGMFLLLQKNPRWKRYRLLKRMTGFDFAACKRLLITGLPIGAAIVMEVMLFQFIGFMASRENAVITGASQIAANYAGIIFMVPLGIAAALTIRIANAKGTGDKALIRQRSLAGIALCCVFIVPAAIATYLLRTQIAGIYSENAAIMQLAASVLIIAAIFQFFDGVQAVFTGILRGLADTRITLLFAFASYWLIGIPAGWLFAYPMGYGLHGLWAGLALGLIVFSLLTGWRVYQQIRPA